MKLKNPRKGSSNEGSFSQPNYGGSFNRTGPVKIPLKQRINQINEDFNDILSNDGGNHTAGETLDSEKPFASRGSG